MTVRRRSLAKTGAIGCLAVVGCIAIVVGVYALQIWNDNRFENNCVYEGVEYQLGDYRPDGECICRWGRTKQKWVWNCREAWGR